MKIAFLGTGLMGAPMARRLAVHHDVNVWNRSPHKAEALADTCTVAVTPQDAAANADIVITMLLDGPATKAVLTDALMTVTSRQAVLINMGSVDIATDTQLFAQASDHGLAYLDAPVSGGVVGAEAGTLAILVGGTADAFETARPVLGLLGQPTHLGPVGAGQVAKLANQLIVATTIGAVAEGFQLAQAGGCDIAALRKALLGGFAESRILDLHGARMATGDFTPGGRSVTQLKDLDNAMTLAADNDLELPLSQTVTDAFRDFVEVHNGGERDHAAYYEWLALRRS